MPDTPISKSPSSDKESLDSPLKILRASMVVSNWLLPPLVAILAGLLVAHRGVVTVVAVVLIAGALGYLLSVLVRAALIWMIYALFILERIATEDRKGRR